MPRRDRDDARERAPDPPQHAAAGGDDGGLLGGAAARRRGLLAHVRAGDRRRGPARARAGDLPRRLGARRGPGRAADGPDRAPPRDRGRLRGRRGRLRPHRAGHEPRLDAARDPRLRADRRGERDRAADPHGGRRPLPARAPRPRDLLRAVRLGLRRDPRPGRVRAAVLRPRARRRRAHRAVARGRGDQPARARARAADPARPEADRGDHRRPRRGRAPRRRAPRSARSCGVPASARRCWPRSPRSA